MLAKLPETRSARWALVRQLADAYRNPGRDFKASPDGIAAHLTERGVSIPLALREWYALAAELTDLWSKQDRLLHPAELRINGDWLEIAAENQYCWQWGIPLDELGDEDPRVVRLPFDADERLTSPAVSVFAIQLFLSETFWGGRHAHMEIVWNVEGELLEYLLGEFQRCDLPDLYLWAPTSFYEREGVLLRLDIVADDEVYWGVAARNAQTFDEVMNELRGVGITFEL